MNEVLGHFSLERMIEIEPRDQTENPDFKPQGLWFEVQGESDWQSWCEAESYADLEECFHYQIHIDPAVNMLTITNALDLDTFHERFQKELIPSIRPYIDWRSVAAEYDGIQIAPYMWERRLTGHGSSHWYYSWDCASGCIWEPKASTIELLRPPLQVFA